MRMVGRAGRVRKEVGIIDGRNVVAGAILRPWNAASRAEDIFRLMV